MARTRNVALVASTLMPQQEIISTFLAVIGVILAVSNTDLKIYSVSDLGVDAGATFTQRHCHM